MIRLSYLLRVTFFSGVVIGIPMGLFQLPELLDELKFLGLIVGVLFVPILSGLASASYSLLAYPIYKVCARKNIFKLKFIPSEHLNQQVNLD